MSEKRYSITQAAALLDRSVNTLRSWDRNVNFPEELRPYRDDRGHRYWTPELIKKIQKWIDEAGFYPGNSIAYKPDSERRAEHLRRIRESRRRQKAGSSTEMEEKLDELYELVVEAFEKHNRSLEDVVDLLPTVAKQRGIPMEEALEVVRDAANDVQAHA